MSKQVNQLINIIKRHYTVAHKNAAESVNEDARLFGEGKMAAIELLAECFSREAGVDRDAFLKACGLSRLTDESQPTNNKEIS